MKQIKQAKKILNDATSFGGRAPDFLTTYIRHAITSLIPVAIDYMILFLLVDYYGWFYIPAAVVGFVVGGVVGYFATRGWGFSRTEVSHKYGISMFLFINFVGLATTVGLLTFFIEVCKIYYLIARAMSAIIAGLVMFVMNYRLTFKMHEVKKK